MHVQTLQFTVADLASCKMSIYTTLSTLPLLVRVTIGMPV